MRFPNCIAGSGTKSRLRVWSAVRAGWACALGMSLAASGWAQSAVPRDLTTVSLEDLMNIQVTSVSKKERPLASTGAAVFVITRGDIRRSGMRNIPDLLRMAPGVEVARIDANAWAISIRGFNHRYSTKVLVLIDGRSVYNPASSGVFWDQQDVPLGDIERIEVIRGPGGTVWGANAVNGVINIITRSSKDTQGGLIFGGIGSEESAAGLVQYGGEAGKKGHYRVFGRYFKVESSTAAGGGDAADGWHGSHVGMRTDWTLSGRDTMTVQGDLFGASEGQTISTLFSNRLPDSRTFDDKVRTGSGNILGRWEHKFSNGSEATVQGYFDRARRLDLASTNILNTGDVDLQYRFRVGSRHDIVVGAGYRLTDQVLRRGYSNAFGTGHRRDSLVSTSIQDEVKLTATVALILGAKVEHNSYTGLEFQPSAQLVWSPSVRQTVWASAARAIRQPAWVDAEARLDVATFPLEGGGFALIQLLGSHTVEAERLLDFEVGYRAQAAKWLSLDFTAFQSRYSGLQSTEPGTPYFTLDPAPSHLVLPSYFRNLAYANNYGGEVFAIWNVTSRWQLSPGFSFLQMKIGLRPASRDTSTQASVGYSPKHQAQLRSTLDLRHNLEWDTSAYFVGALRYGPVPGYTRLDTRLGWRAGESIEFSVAGQNLLTPRHIEFWDGMATHVTQVQRSVVGTVTWRF
jgi:iron complex outermembrane recepter protein